ncbi:hypothetical protein ACFQ88_26565 [Paenibacillus sp. NPDC056579]|nr:hypothetical protein DVH26_30065 [Paenibacillus sp. H1-7]
MGNHFEEMEKKRLEQNRKKQQDKETDAVRAVNNAKASLEIDGMKVSEETEAIMLKYAKGELTEQQVLELIKPKPGKTD